MKKSTLEQLTNDEARRIAFESAYTKDADAEQRITTLNWMHSWHHGAGYKHSSLQDHYIGFCLALSTHISVQEAWEAAGGNPGITATKEELIDALKLLDEVCDEADDTPVVSKPKVVRKSPKTDAGERMRKIASAPKKAQQTTQEIGKEIRQYRQAMKMNQTDFGEYIGLAQTEVSSLERGLVTKRSDGGVSSVEKAQRFLDSVRKLFANKDAPVVVTAKVSHEPYMSGDSSHQTSEPKINWDSIGTREGPNIADVSITVVPEKKDLGNVTMHVTKPRDMHDRNVSMAFQTNNSWLRPHVEDARYDLIPDIKAAQLLQSNFRMQIDDPVLSEDEVRYAMRAACEVLANLSFDDKDAIIWSDFKTFVDAQQGKAIPRSQNVCVGPINLYVRAGNCFYFNHERKNAIEIARIDIPEELQGRGLGKYFFKEVTRFAASRGISYIVVAQVHNENFREQLVAWGFTRYQPADNMEDYIYVKVLF